MTVVLVLSNGQIGGIVADKRKIVDGRDKEDTTRKIYEIFSGKFNGVLSWSGSRKTLDQALRYAGTGMPDSPLDELITPYGTRFADVINGYMDDKIGAAIKREPPQTQGGIIEQTVKDILAEFCFLIYDKELQSKEPNKERDRVRIGYCSFQPEKRKFIFDTIPEDEKHYEMGGPKEKGKSYIFGQLRGRSFESLSEQDILMLLAGGYIASTTDVAVGGIPSFAIIGKEGVRHYSNRESCALGRLIGYWDMGIIQRKNEDWLYGQIEAIRSGNTNYEAIAKATYCSIPDVKSFCPTFNQLVDIKRSFQEQGLVPFANHQVHQQ